MSHHTPLIRIALISSALLNCAPAFATEDGVPAASADQRPALSPKEAGARFGQALGAIEICYGSKVTDKAKALGDSYNGAEQEAFKAQAGKIYDAWVKVKNCKNQQDPNQCKIMMDKSCAMAEAEIGSSGSAMPGLVEFMRH
jgi:hypothetical protein